MTIGRTLKFAAAILKNSTSPELDAEVLLAYVLKCSRADLTARPKRSLSSGELIKFLYLILKRRTHWPVAYLTGQKEFYGRVFRLNRYVLVPRPETEILVDQAIYLARQPFSNIKTIVDIGTGSGAIAITLALELPGLKILATDISKPALKVAQKNAQNWPIDSRLIFLPGDILEPLLKKNLLDRSTLLVANPPYLLNTELTPELKHEPKLALFNGVDGLAWHKKLFEQLKSLADDKRPSQLILEISPITAAQLLDLIKIYFPNSPTKLLKDLSDHNRVLIINF